jgi:D-3-phosphoglycerate dehydrogenase
MARILITTVPFGDHNDFPIQQLTDIKVGYLINPLGRKLKENELLGMVGDAEILIAGTEPMP